MALVDRARNILTTPETEWPVIAAEPRDIPALYAGYIVPLAAIPPLASAVGGILFGGPLFATLINAVLSFVLGLVGLYVISLIAAKLAPSFGGDEDQAQALKLLAYSQTAGWLAGVFLLIPMLSVVSLIGSLYGIYLLWLGISPVMRVPAERRLVFLLVLIACVVGLAFLIGFVLGALFGVPRL